MFQSEDIKRYFDNAFKKWGDSIHTTGWYNIKTQEIRFKILSSIGELPQKAVLDLGCGLGDLFGYLQKKKIELSYEGIDLSPNIIKLAKKKYPQAQFFCEDFLNPKFNKKYDYILCSGALNYGIKEKEAYLATIIGKMFHQAGIGVGFNLLFAGTSVEYSYKSSFNYYYPEEIHKICKKISENIVIKQFYLPNDFTVFLYK
jgi:SAM-dependent methyltransferase